jgi:hypothetical protein
MCRKSGKVWESLVKSGEAKARRNYSARFVPAEMAEKVGFDAFYLQNTAVEKFHPHYFVALP